MNENFHNATAEIKRADHLIFVSLKYTRTVDVIKNIIKRLIAAFDYAFKAILEKAHDDGDIEEIPKFPRLVMEEVQRLHPDKEEIKNFIEFYRLLKKIDKADFDAAQEYRRHVTMTAHLREETVEISIDIISDYYQRTREFLSYVDRLIKGETLENDSDR